MADSSSKKTDKGLETFIADDAIIDRILQRKTKRRHPAREVDLKEVLREILLRANEFVPSDSGSILLDDPLLKWDKEHEGKLYFMACFGVGSSELVGTHLPDDVGIVGATYGSGKPYLSKDVSRDDRFYDVIDKKTQYESKSILAMPIKIYDSIVGVIELINRKEKVNYDDRDLSILEIFASYTSTLIKNALDARRFEDLSKRDNLTGLYNDRYFYERLDMETQKAIDEESDLSLIFFDLDHFKGVNDTHGHLVGSQVLKEVATIIEEVFLDSGAAASRYGGDEFVILMPGCSLEKSNDYGETLREAIERNIFVREGTSPGEPPLNIEGVITCSVGIASLEKDEGKELKKMKAALIRAADSAMYRAKDLGKNRVSLDKDLDTSG
jgi:diguanylate cyclase (GGDEF)-like protein